MKHNQDGAVSGLAISLVFAVLFLIGALGFAGWAFTSRQDYKVNSDQKAAIAVDAAKKQQSIDLNKEFAEREKNPLKTYTGPDAFGSLHIEYPKTWSGYVDTTNSSNAVDGFFNPDVVPSTTNQASVFALRVQVTSTTYSQTLQALAGQQQAGLKVSPYALPKLPKVVGVQATGKLDNQKDVTMVVLPLRSQTLKIWTEGTQHIDDLNKIILPNFTFVP